MIVLGLENEMIWLKNIVTLADERNNKVMIHASEHLSPCYERLLDRLDERGNIPKS